jgi:hypothetical protein
MGMSARFLHAIAWTRTRSRRSLCDKVVFLVAVVVLVVLSGSCTDKSVLISAAPTGRRATNGHIAPSGLLRKSFSGGAVVSKSCPEDDIGVKTYLAQTVFEGKARSRSPVRDGVYNVTFVVQKVYKGPEPGFLRSQVRLQFAEKARVSNNYRKCDDGGDKNSVMRANITRGGKYIVFVDKIEQHIFKARGEPVKRNEKAVRAVNHILCPTCGKFTQLNNHMRCTSSGQSISYSLLSLMRLLLDVTFQELIPRGRERRERESPTSGYVSSILSICYCPT